MHAEDPKPAAGSDDVEAHQLEPAEPGEHSQSEDDDLEPQTRLAGMKAPSEADKHT